MPLTDFPNGLRDAADYLNPGRHLQDLPDPVGELERLIPPTLQDAELKEIICQMMAGGGFLLPNSQIAIYQNLANLLDILSGGALYDILGPLLDLYETYLYHNSIDSVLGRLGDRTNEISSVASMLNFCNQPLDPVPIPTMLEGSMESFLGSGQDIIDQLGTFAPSGTSGTGGTGSTSTGTGTGGTGTGSGTRDNILDAIIPGQFNTNFFTGGLLGRISDRYDDVISGNLERSWLDEIEASVLRVSNTIKDVMDRENNVNSIHSKGGSEFAQRSREENPHRGMAVLFNSDSESVQSISSIAGRLRALYENLGSYPVTAKDGTKYNNIFETFVEADMLNLLSAQQNPIPTVSERIPIYDYCGEVVGYTHERIQGQPEKSLGDEPQPIRTPGFQSGGLPTDPMAAAQRITPESDTWQRREIRSNNVTTTDDNDMIVTWSERITPLTDTIWFADVQAVGKRTNGTDVTSIRVECIIQNRNNMVTIEGTEGNKTVFNSIGAENYDLILEATSEFIVKVKGDTGHDVDWALRIIYQQV